MCVCVCSAHGCLSLIKTTNHNKEAYDTAYACVCMCVCSFWLPLHLIPFAPFKCEFVMNWTAKKVFRAVKLITSNKQTHTKKKINGRHRRELKKATNRSKIKTKRVYIMIEHAFVCMCIAAHFIFFCIKCLLILFVLSLPLACFHLRISMEIFYKNSDIYIFWQT